MEAPLFCEGVMQPGHEAAEVRRHVRLHPGSGRVHVHVPRLQGSRAVRPPPAHSPAQEPASSPVPAPLATADAAAPEEHDLVGERVEMWHVFAGMPRPGEISELMRAGGVHARDFDRLRDPECDMRSTDYVDELVRQARAGPVAVAVFGIPCETWSVGPRRVKRPLDEPSGRPPQSDERPDGLTPSEAAQVGDANLMCRGCCRIAIALHLRDGAFVFEHPAARHILGTPFYWAAKSDRASIMRMPEMMALQAATGAVWVFAPHCYFHDGIDGSTGPQKWSMYLISRNLLPFLGEIRRANCHPPRHTELAWGVDDLGHRRALGHAQYSPGLARVIADGLLAFLARGPWARDTVGGELAWGHGLHPDVRTAIEAASRRSLHFASHRRRIVVPPDQRWCQPMPAGADAAPPPADESWEWLHGRSADSDGSDDETLETAAVGAMRPTRSRTPLPGVVALKVAYWMMWLPNDDSGPAGERQGLHDILRWRDAAAVAMACMRAGKRCTAPATLVVPAKCKHPAFREILMDCRNPQDCVQMRRSTRRTRMPGRQMDRAAYRQLADEVGWRAVDADIVDQAGEGGVESRSRCGFYTVLMFHHAGAREQFQALDDIVRKDADEKWILGPFCYCPPTEPFRALPRNVVLQTRTRQAEDGTFHEWQKPRGTTNSTAGPSGGRDTDDSPNACIDSSQKSMALPSAVRHAQAAGVVDAFGDGAAIRGRVYSTDRENAFTFLMVTRVEWATQGFVWDLPGGPRVEGACAEAADFRGGPPAGPRDAAAWRRLCAAEALGDAALLPRAPAVGEPPFGWWIGSRCHFGGAHMPQRYGRVTLPVRVRIYGAQGELDERYPLPPCALRIRERRRALQAAGLLPLGDEQLNPRDIQSFIDDNGGSGLDDVIGIPPELAHIQLDLSCMGPNGGRPARLDSRIASYARIDILYTLRVGFAISPKTQVGDRVVSLGLRICVDEHTIDCPPTKRDSIVADCQRIRDQLNAPAGISRQAVERLTGRLGNLSQIEPALLQVLHVGYAISAVAWAGQAAPRFVKLSLNGRRRAELERLLATAQQLLQANRGAALMLLDRFRLLDGDGVVVAFTDASRASTDDGAGGWAFDPADHTRLFVVSEPWPTDIKRALDASAARAARRPAGFDARFPMPAAELFTCWAVVEAVREATSATLLAAVSVGDCRPAAGAMDRETSRSAPMRTLLRAIHAGGEQWLPVWVCRELNTDADELSHPSLIAEVIARAVEAGRRIGERWSVVHLRIPERCWAVAREAAGL